MADYGVYFQITNGLGVPLYFRRFVSAEGECCLYDGPGLIPSDAQPHRVHLNDPCTARGAEGTIYFAAEVQGQLREYAWWGNCPVWSPSNGASGPGLGSWNQTGHPLSATVGVNPDTSGWSPVSQPIERVFVLALENRSFDHLLGFSGLTGTDAQSGQPTTVNGLSGTEGNSYAGVTYTVSQPAAWSMPVDPGHEFLDVVEQLGGQGATYQPGQYPAVNNAGFVANYVQNGGSANPQQILQCYSPEQLPVLVALAKEFALCDQWYASMPGPTWPNRYFMMAASSGGLDHSPTTAEMALWESLQGFAFEHGSIFGALSSAGQTWRLYRGDQGPFVGSIPIASALKGVTLFDAAPYSHFADDVATGNYPWTFTFIEPNYGDVVSGTYKGGQSQHPMDSVQSGEAMIKATYEALRNSPLWAFSLLIVTWDEHGGFYDHVLPGSAVPPGDKIVMEASVNEYGFTFNQYGPRVPAVIVSPLIPQNLIDHRLYDHASVPATLEAVFGMPALTQRDAKALPVTPLVSLLSPRQTPERLPGPAAGTSVTPAPRALSDDDPIGGNLPGFLNIAMQHDTALSPPEDRPGIVARVAAIRTRGEARSYLEEFEQKLQRTKLDPALQRAAVAEPEAAAASAAPATGAVFTVHISPRNDSATFVTAWSVNIEQRGGGWSGSINSQSPEAVVVAPDISGAFNVVVVASGPAMDQRQLTAFAESDGDVVVPMGGRAVIGIIATDAGRTANYWVTVEPTPAA